MKPHEMLQQPCPCGSDKRFGDCCTAAGLGPPSATTRAVTRELERLLADREFASDDEMQAFLEAQVAAHNHGGLEDFQGLTPLQMSALLYRPFESPPLAELERRLPATPEAPALELFSLLADAADDKGIDLATRGNLPLKLVKAAHARLLERWQLRAEWIGAITTERDVGELHFIRLVARQAGLLRKAHGRLFLTAAAERLLRRDDRPGLYRRLLETYCRRFNWAYGDGFPELPIIQHSFGFSFYLLATFGDEWRASTFYGDAFVQAFPHDAASEAEPDGFAFEREAERAWRLRTLERFGRLFGLVELAPGEGDQRLIPLKPLLVRRTPLLTVVFPPGEPVGK